MRSGTCGLGEPGSRSSIYGKRSDAIKAVGFDVGFSQGETGWKVVS
jgi:hypothetical protein